ncbi:unnamed protein product [Aspergillus oryzae]|nr:unnamed protein product [Aspergillus oryzae]
MGVQGLSRVTIDPAMSWTPRSIDDLNATNKASMVARQTRRGEGFIKQEIKKSTAYEAPLWLQEFAQCYQQAIGTAGTP